MRICLIASSRFPIREPFAGGLEALTHALARELVRRGHEVSLFAGARLRPAAAGDRAAGPPFTLSAAARADVGDAAGGLDGRAPRLPRADARPRPDRRRRFDVVHNNSLHHLPVAMAATLRVPVVTTLHTPPIAVAGVGDPSSPPGAGTFAAVSAHTARAWAHAVADATSILNGVDIATGGAPGPGGGPAVWSGRLVPEKAPHLAIDAAARGRRAARAGRARSSTAAYFDDAGRARGSGPTSRTSATSTTRELARLRRRGAASRW